MVANLAKKVRSQHATIKQNIEYSCQYFKKNCERWEKARNSVFNSSLTIDDIAMLKELQMPQLEFNMGEAYLSRLRGEFSKYEPSVIIRGQDDRKFDPKLIEIIEGHMIALFQNNKNDNFEYDVYTDLLAGGFSVVKAYTEYESAMSFTHVIRNKRVYYPTLCGFDPMAQTSHKGDGRWSFERFPKSKDDVIDMFGEEAVKELKHSVCSSDGISWNYINYNEEIVMLVDYFCKEKKKKKIVQLANGEVISDEEYQEKLAQWDQSQFFSPPPAIKGKPRIAEIDEIHQYFVIADKVLHHEIVDYKYLPHVFFDGNSQVLRESITAGAEQMTRPYLWHATGVQKLKNYAGSLLANGLENSIRHKLMMPKKGIPPESKEAYTNFQKASVLIYNSHDPSNPEIPLPEPKPVPQLPLPPEIVQAFQLVDQTTQLMLGNFDADLARMSKSQMSGIAIQEQLTLSNAAAMPFITGYLKGLNHLANVNLDLISKYYTEARVIPVYSKKKGVQEFQRINEPGAVQFDFDADKLHIKIEAGANFQLQKSQALDQIISLINVLPSFQRFVSTKGMKWIFDNIDMKGIDQLRQEIDQFMTQEEKMQQNQLQQQQNMPNPLIIKTQLEQTKLKEQAKNNELEIELKAAQIGIAKQEADTNQLKVFSDLGISKQDIQAKKDRAEAEKVRAAVDLIMQQSRLHNELKDTSHQHDKDALELLHKHLNLITKEDNQPHITYNK